MSVSVYGSGDPTTVWVNSLSLGAGEYAVGGFLLVLALLLEMLGRGLTTIRQLTQPQIGYEVVRTPEASLQPAYSLGYSHFRGKYVDLGLPRVHYIDEGPANATETLVLLHGMPFWSYSYMKLLPHLVSQGYRVVVPDFVGFGKSDKYRDYRAYTVALHKETLKRLLTSLHIPGRVTLVGHNWGWMIGAAVAKDWPGYFSRQVILNTNNLPDGEANIDRYQDTSVWGRFLIANSFFLVFRAMINVFKEIFPLGILIFALNSRYTSKELAAFVAPHPDAANSGGTTSFPLLVPVFASDPEAGEMRATRQYLSRDYTPTLVAYSDYALLPFLSQGDFVVGNRPGFYEKLIPGLRGSIRIPDGGHLIQYDQPAAVASAIINFMRQT